MDKTIRLNKLLLNSINKEFLNIANFLLKKKYKNLEYVLSDLSRKNEKKLFEVFNLSLKIYDFLPFIKKKIEKKIKKKLILWTYPQVRIDLKKKINKFSSPAHMDQWILSPKDKGYIAWFPINKEGGKIKFLINKPKKLIVKKDKYWGLAFKKKQNMIFETKNIEFGKCIIFNHQDIHQSDLNNQRITIQYRFRELNKNFKQRGINQVIDNKIKRYWIKKNNAN